MPSKRGSRNGTANRKKPMPRRSAGQENPKIRRAGPNKQPDQKYDIRDYARSGRAAQWGVRADASYQERHSRPQAPKAAIRCGHRLRKSPQVAVESSVDPLSSFGASTGGRRGAALRHDHGTDRRGARRVRTREKRKQWEQKTKTKEMLWEEA